MAALDLVSVTYWNNVPSSYFMFYPYGKLDAALYLIQGNKRFVLLHYKSMSPLGAQITLLPSCAFNRETPGLDSRWTLMDPRTSEISIKSGTQTSLNSAFIIIQLCKPQRINIPVSCAYLRKRGRMSEHPIILHTFLVSPAKRDGSQVISASQCH